MMRYMLEFMLCSALFFALYRLLLEGRTAHRAARVYLVGSMLLAVVIPLLELPLYPAQTIFYEVPINLWDDASAIAATSTDVVASAPAIVWSEVLQNAALIIYLLVVVINVGVVVRKLWLIRRLRQRSQLSFYEAYTIAENDAVREPFSFWRTIFLSRCYTPREREQIVAHEASHVRHRHTAERLALEALRCVAWFNPFVWVTATALAEVQEWEADQDVLHQGYDVYEYRQLIFRQLFGYNPDIASGLKSQTSKKRFLMMTNFQKGKLSLVRYGAVIPLVAVMVLAFGAVRAEAEVSPQGDVAMQSQPQQPDELKSEVYISAEGNIFFNGEEMTLDELRSSLEKLRAAKGADAVLDIRTETATKMGAVENVKLAARQSKVLKVRYIS
ncbi:MAG: M48 family metalloprotease, partial [Alistipes sp.]|nr:M48 family metalloprotease [Alistipes sp.]